jgi:glutamyl-tRNA synthetase
LSSAPKYNLLYDALGWQKPVYVTVSPIMRDARHKLSKRAGDPTYEDLLEQGYLPEAILNYIALLGWSPGGERELYTLPELEAAFDISGLSKSPAIFDVDKLTHFNGEYIRAKSPEDFARLAEPYIRQTAQRPDAPIAQLAALIQPRCERLTDIPAQLDFFDELPEYSTELYVHKKSKTDAVISLKMLRNALPTLQSVADWDRDALHAALTALAESLGTKNATLLWPLRIAVSGKAVTPGGAVELCAALGRDATLCRVAAGIEKLEAAQ